MILSESLTESLSFLFVSDPVLRRWALGRLRKRWQQNETFTAHQPPYLPATPAEAALRDGGFPELAVRGKPSGSLELRLPGQGVTVEEGETRTLFTRSFDEPELAQGLHSFGWLSLQPDADPAWVAALWQGWSAHHGLPQPDDSPAWDAAVAARRALNLLDYARTHGLPGPREESVARLAAHAPAILESLDWREDGTHDTRMIVEACALIRLGLAFGLENHAKAGFVILAEEAKRQFGQAGLLSQGATHHHQVAVMDIAGVWLATRRLNRPEIHEMDALLRRVISPLPALAISGVLPMVGDLSAEFPPEFLVCLLADAPLDQGWTALLSQDDRDAFAALRDSARLYDLEALRADGWLRQTVGPWSGLWHGFPTGWSPVRGYGHADLGSATLHYEGVPVFVDPGNGASGAEGRAYRSAAAHGGLTLEGSDPYPRNRALYCDAFRRDIAGKPPVLQAEFDGASCVFEGYSRILGHNEVQRRWRVEGRSLILDDVVNGTGRVLLARRLITCHPLVLQEDGSVILSAPGFALRIRGDVRAELKPGKVWTAWGEFQPAQAIVFQSRVNFPWQGRIIVEPLAQ
ncbi:MAG TPA: heparinase II/III family protein [Candidatus Sulfotelmatobacter sp.]|jgi:hypothetical protein|nr:heparinase II/III family protein [Candidatus Sulfotelmatobacter sp.]